MGASRPQRALTAALVLTGYRRRTAAEPAKQIFPAGTGAGAASLWFMVEDPDSRKAEARRGGGPRRSTGRIGHDHHPLGGAAILRCPASALPLRRPEARSERMSGCASSTTSDLVPAG